MNTTFAGRQAESYVADYLTKLNYKILDKNWRSPTAEIDIVARLEDIIYLVEVKYRQNLNFGDGSEYVQYKKVKQMTYAANQWAWQNNWSGDYRLIVVAVDSQLNIDIYEL